MHADKIIQNKTANPISVLHLKYADPDYSTQVAVDGATLKRDDSRLRYQIYNFNPPMQPGEQRHLRFTVTRAPRGFENSLSVLQVVQNGTFFNNSVAPQIGYQASRELDNKNKRKKYGLKEKDLMPGCNATAQPIAWITTSATIPIGSTWIPSLPLRPGKSPSLPVRSCASGLKTAVAISNTSWITSR